MPKANILIVEDERIVARDIESTLLRADYAVPAVVATGEQAIAKAEECKPDLVLMDIVLSGEIDGIEAARQIRLRWNIPSIYLTAYGDDALLERAKATEPLGYIFKPFEEHQLLTTIEMALHQSRAAPKRAYDALRESEARNQAFLTAIPDLMFRLNRAGIVLDFGPGKDFQMAVPVNQMLGKPAKDIANQSPLIHKDAIPQALRYMERALQTGEPQIYESRVSMPDGSVREFETRLVVCGDDQVLGIARDVTERKQAEQKLAHAHALITALSQVAAHLQATADPDLILETLGAELKKSDLTSLVLLMEPDGQTLVIRHIAATSRALEFVTKLTGAGLRGFRITSEQADVWAKSAERREVVWNSNVIPLAVSLLPGVSVPIVEQALGLIGITSTTPVVGLPLLFEQRLIGYLVLWGKYLREENIAALSVFASQVAATLEIAREQQATRAAEEHYRGLFERVPLGLYRIAKDGRFLDANPALVQMLGYPDRAALLAMNVADLHANLRERRLYQVLLKRKGTIHDQETLMRRHDGTPIWVRTNLRAAHDTSGQILWYDGSVRDITERKQAEQELARRADEFAALYDTARDLAAP